jgi:hypothetical protein
MGTVAIRYNKEAASEDLKNTTMAGVAKITRQPIKIPRKIDTIQAVFM